MVMDYVLLVISVVLFFLANIPSKVLPALGMIVDGVRKFDNGLDGGIAPANCRHLQNKILPYYILGNVAYVLTISGIHFAYITTLFKLEWHIFAGFTTVFSLYYLFKYYSVCMDNWLILKHITYTMTKEFTRKPREHQEEEKRHREQIKKAHDNLFDVEFHPLFNMAIITVLVIVIDVTVEYLIKPWLS